MAQLPLIYKSPQRRIPRAAFKAEPTITTGAKEDHTDFRKYQRPNLCVIGFNEAVPRG